jgi:organic radical activating enzyme
VPSYHATIDRNANVLLCDCEAWLPIPVGQVDDFDSLDSVWNSDAATFLQKNINDKKFTWCAVEHCGILTQSSIPKTYSLNLSIDDSCNLQCPSCRRDSVMLTSGAEYDYRLQSANTILNWLEKYDLPIHITMSGNGDPLASLIMRPIIKNFQPKDHQTFTLFTNGLLIKKQINEGMPIFNAITEFKISVDAGSKEIYEDVRRPGRWEVLLENFDYLKSVGKNSQVQLNFAVQNKNYKDIPNFVELCQHYGFRGIIHQLDENKFNNRIDNLKITNYTEKNSSSRLLIGELKDLNALSILFSVPGPTSAVVFCFVTMPTPAASSFNPKPSLIISISSLKLASVVGICPLYSSSMYGSPSSTVPNA